MKKSSQLVFLTIVCCLIHFKKSEAQWTNMNGPYLGTYITCLAQNGSYLFAGTSDYGVFASTDGGNNWMEVNNNIVNRTINDLLLVGDTLYAATGNGVYRSTDNGNNWTFLNAGLTTTNLYCITATSKALYTGTVGGGVFKSTSQGNNWTPVNNGFTNLYIDAMASFNDVLYVGRPNSEIYISDNEGASWIPRNLPDSFIQTYTFISAANKVFAGTSHGVYYTTDTAKNWVWLTNSSGMGIVFDMAVSGSNIYAATNNGVFVGTNYGAQWTQLVGGISSFNTIVTSLLLAGNDIYGGTQRGCFLSTDGGINWTDRNHGLAANRISAFTVMGEKLITSCYQNSICYTTNMGGSWQVLTLPPQSYSGLNPIYAEAGNLWGASIGKVYLSTDTGQTWVRKDTGFIGAPISAFARCDSGLLVATQGNGIKRTPDDGNTWKSFAGFVNVNAMVSDGFRTYEGETNNMRYSTNGGTTWTIQKNGLPTTNVHAIAIAGTDVFAGLQTYGVYRNTFSGTTWTDYSQGIGTKDVWCLKQYGDTLFAGTYQFGVYMQTDINNPNNPWVNISSGLGDMTIYALEIQNDYLIAGTNKGAWKLPLIEGLGIDNLNQNKIAIYPNPSSGNVNIIVDEHLVGSTATVIDLTGRVVLQAEITHPKTVIEGRDLNSGVYFVTVAGAIQKLVVAK